MQYKMLFVLFLSLFAPTSDEKDSLWTNKIFELYAHNEKKISVTQGCVGTITTTVGNCMPGERQIPPVCVTYPVSRKIRVYEYTTHSQGKQSSHTAYSSFETKLITTCVADSEGFFQTALLPGKYSIIIEEKGSLTCCWSDGYGGLGPMIVDSAKVTLQHLRLDYAAH